MKLWLPSSVKRAYFGEKAEGVMLQPPAKTQKDQKHRVFSHTKGPSQRLRVGLTYSVFETRGSLRGLTVLSLSCVSRS